MGIFLALLIRATETDNGFAADQRRLGGVGAGIFHRHHYFFRVVAVDIRNHLPTVGAETLYGIVGEPAFHFTVNGNAIVVVEGHQFTQAQGACQGCHFVGDPFHHAAITQEAIGVVINNGVPITIELPR